jgi:hypothetical protein
MAERVDLRFRAHGQFEQPLRLVESETWVIVRRADFRGAAPFVISRKEWDALPRKARSERDG